MRLEKFFKQMASTRITFRDTSWPGYHGSSPGRLTGTVGIEFSLAEIKKKNHLHQGLKNQKRLFSSNFLMPFLLLLNSNFIRLINFNIITANFKVNKLT
jgi:hypothetical protein